MATVFGRHRGFFFEHTIPERALVRDQAPVEQPQQPVGTRATEGTGRHLRPPGVVVVDVDLFVYENGARAVLQRGVQRELTHLTIGQVHLALGLEGKAGGTGAMTIALEAHGR